MNFSPQIATLENTFRSVLGMLGVKSWRTLQSLIYQTFPSVNDLQNLCATLFRCQIEFNAEFYKNSEDEDEPDIE